MLTILPTIELLTISYGKCTPTQTRDKPTKNDKIYKNLPKEWLYKKTVVETANDNNVCLLK